MDIGATEINQWHKQRGFAAIGYHIVIRRDGKVEGGRHLDAIGAHCKDDRMNTRAIGVCLVGGDSALPLYGNNNFTDIQFITLGNVLRELMELYPGVSVVGHGSVKGVHKACPCFSVPNFMKTNFNREK